MRRGILAGVMAISAAVSGAAAWAQSCAEDTVRLRGGWGEAQFQIELADDAAERAQGLMHRESMPRSAGMLFVYERPGDVTFWMRNTLIPLDMIFADRHGIVRYVQHNAQPLLEKPIYGGNNIQYVLEINGGLAEQIGIAKGSEILHIRIPQDLAAWPCAEN